VDRQGQVYIADAMNGRVRMITPDGVIHTVAGTGPPPRRVPTRPPENPELFRPESVAVDGRGLLYVADGRVVRTVASDGTVRILPLRTSNGDNGVLSAMTPRDVSVGPDDALFIADGVGNRILRVSRDGMVTLLAGGGTLIGEGIPATSAQVRRPISVAADTQGAVHFVEEGGRLRTVSTDGRLTTLLTRVGLADIAVVNRDLYLVTRTGGRVTRLMPDGSETCVAGGCVSDNGLGFSGDGGPATEAQLGLPQAIAIDVEGNLYIAEASGNRIRKASAVAGIAVPRR
jgi:sugar lactone lactonase YvrE